MVVTSLVFDNTMIELAYCILASPIPFGVALPTFTLLGFSLCFIDNGINTLSFLFPAPLSTLILNYTHAFFGVGGLIGPPVVTNLLTTGGCTVGQGEPGKTGDSCPPDVSYLHTWRAAYIVWIGVGAWIFVFVTAAHFGPSPEQKERQPTELNGSAEKLVSCEEEQRPHFKSAVQHVGECAEVNGHPPIVSPYLEQATESSGSDSTAKSLDATTQPELPKEATGVLDFEDSAGVRTERTSAQKYTAAFRVRHVWVGMVYLFVYVGCEVSIGQWVSDDLKA
ncbi:hypothetical protein HDU93_002729 [Gonapodya sp. JEL0774]|nr:hypothetical protein HDU93_002729 [Gonapodya sp. JEL0774]